MTMRRTGTTLVEVLVAIFVMAIGLLTLLTLFPLGALSMSQAIRDDRTAQAAANAAACAAARGLRNDDKVVYEFDPQGNNPPYKRDVFREALARNPNGTPDSRLPVLPDGNPSYPILVDPQGYLLGATTYGDLGAALPGYPRRIPRFVWGPETAPFNRRTHFQYSWLWFANRDDMTFKDGVPPNPIELEGRYTWTYMLKRKDVAKPSVVDLAVIVSAGRPFELQSPGVLMGETTFGSVVFDPTTNLVKVPFAGTQPDFKKGQWILDSSTPVPTSNPIDTHGYFYRIVGVSGPINEGGVNKMVLELQNPPKEAADAAHGRLTLFDHVVEVFEKGPGWLP